MCVCVCVCVCGVCVCVCVSTCLIRKHCSAELVKFHSCNRGIDKDTVGNHVHYELLSD